MAPKSFTKILVAVALMVMVGCGTFTTRIKPISEMTPLEKATLATATYNNLAKDYRTRITLPNLSGAEKKILHAEYKTMTRMWPAIDLYYRAVKDPTVSVSEAVIAQVNEFLRTYRY